MIIDCHSHIWSARSQLGRAEAFSCLLGAENTQALPDEHRVASEPADMVFVLGFVSKYLEAEIPNDYISSYVNSNPGRLIGFAGVDPAGEDCSGQLQQLHDEQGFAGLTISPACQNFHPCDTRAMRVYEQAEKLGMPVYFLGGMVLPVSGIFTYAQPSALDEVARSFPELKIVISHLGYPWIEQTIALLAKHPNVYSDIAGLTERHWQAYRALTLAYEYDVIEKLFFASDFPCHSVKSAVESLYSINQITIGPVMPAVPREQLRSIVERDSLALLGLKPAVEGEKIAVPAKST